MSGVYIKGMEMPTNCCQCPVNMEVCKRGYKYLLEHPELYDKRADDCPLVPVPDHGDLIDRDPFVQFIKSHWDSSDQWFVEQLEARHTIIPASGGTEDE